MIDLLLSSSQLLWTIFTLYLRLYTPVNSSYMQANIIAMEKWPNLPLPMSYGKSFWIYCKLWLIKIAGMTKAMDVIDHMTMLPY